MSQALSFPLPTSQESLQQSIAGRTYPVIYPPDDPAEPEEIVRLVDDRPSFSLAELVDQEVRAYQSWNNETGRLFAKHMAELAERIRFSGATTLQDYEARSDLFDQWSAVGEM